MAEGHNKKILNGIESVGTPSFFIFFKNFIFVKNLSYWVISTFMLIPPFLPL